MTTRIDDEKKLAPAQLVIEPLVEVSPPPDGGLQAWTACICVCMVNSFTWGIASCFGVYLQYYISSNVFPEATDFDYTFVGGTNFAGALLTAPMVNALTRKLGTNKPMYIGCVVYAAGWIFASFAKTFWQLVLSQGLLVGIGMGLIWIPATAVIPQWFNKKRALANGVASCGSGFGGVIFGVATTPMIENLSLAWSLRITGLASFVVLMTAAILIRDRNKIIRPKIHPFDASLFKQYQVLLLLGWCLTNLLGYIVFLFSLGAFALSLGLSRWQGGIIVTVLNLGTFVGRPFIGVLCDRFGRITVAGLLTFFNCVCSLAIWIPTNSFGVLVFLALVVGATCGVFWSTISALAAEVVTLKDLPSLLSLTWIVAAFPSLFSEAIALKLRQPDADRPYLHAQIYAGVTYFAASLFMLELRRVKCGLTKRERHG